jgi:hypothetical protein
MGAEEVFTTKVWTKSGIFRAKSQSAEKGEEAFKKKFI